MRPVNGSSKLSDSWKNLASYNGEQTHAATFGRVILRIMLPRRVRIPLIK